MDTNLISGLIGAFAALIAALIPYVVQSRRRDRIAKRGTISDLLVPLAKSDAQRVFKEKIIKAKEIRLCGWALYRTIDENRHHLRELNKQNKEIRILLLDPNSMTVKSLDSVITDTDTTERRFQNWPSVVPKQISEKLIFRTLDVLDESGLTKRGRVRICDSLLPVSLLMLNFEDGTGWASVVIYSLHPDMHYTKSVNFILTDTQSELWKVLQEQFDTAWDDPNFSHSVSLEHKSR